MKIKNRFYHVILLVILLMFLGIRLETEQGVQAAEQQVIRVLDGKITKKELYQIFGTDGNYDYHYSLEEQIAWKRVDYDDRDSTELAENVQNGSTYLLQYKKDPLIGTGTWKDKGTFRFQFYHKIDVQTEGTLPSGGKVTVSGGTQENGIYEVNEEETLTIQFAKVAGYEAQVKVNKGAWQTCENLKYTFIAEHCADITVRYVKADPSKHSVKVKVTGASLGEYSGLTEAKLTDGASFDLVVTPYNEQTTPENDRDAYVKSVKINGKEMGGTYTKTVFYANSYTVSADMLVEIEFAKRLVVQTPEKRWQKYEGDTPLNLYYVTYDQDQKVSAQTEEIETAIFHAIVDQDKTAGFDRETAVVELKANLDSKDYYYELDVKIKDSGADIPWWFPYKEDYWGDWSFGNDEELWEEVRFVLPATERYPKVVTGDYTIFIADHDALAINGMADSVEAESNAQIKGLIEDAVQKKILEANPGATIEAIGQKKISYSYTAPEFRKLDYQEAVEVDVTVTVKKGTTYPLSKGIITVPVLKAEKEAVVNITTDGNGTATYTTDQQKREYQFTLTPDYGYYVDTLQVTTTEDGGTSTETLSVEDLESVNDGSYAYQYALNAELYHEYELYASFTDYQIVLNAKTTQTPELLYYEGMYSDLAAFQTAIEDQFTVALAKDQQTLASFDDFPEGNLMIEYQARKEDSTLAERWLPIGTTLSSPTSSSSADYKCHRFGESRTENIRYCYTLTQDSYKVYSNEVSVSVKDNRIETQIKWKASASTDPIEIAYSDYVAQTDKAGYLKAQLFEGIYFVDSSQNTIPLTGAQVTFTPELDKVNAGNHVTITASYAGDATYRSVTSTLEFELTPYDAEVAVEVNDSVVTYGTSYQLAVTTTPADLKTIQVIMGFDLEDFSLEESLYGLATNVSILTPVELQKALQTYLTGLNPTKPYTVENVCEGLAELEQDEELLKKMGISKDSILVLEQNLQLMASVSESLPVTFGTTPPKDIGFYLVSAIVAEENYEAAMGLGYLMITPKHIRVDLEWKHSIGNSVTYADLQKDGYLDAMVKAQEGVDSAEAEKGLVNFFIGVDRDQKLLIQMDPSQLEPGVYTQMAITADWGNTRYSCLPLIREFVVEGEYVDVQFVGAQEQPIMTSFFKTDETIKLKVRVTDAKGQVLSDTEVKKNLTLTYLPIEDLISEGGSNGSQREEQAVDTSKVPDTSGVYLANAIYQSENASGGLVIGKATVVLILTDPCDAFTVRDTTVSYDGESHGVLIEDAEDVDLVHIQMIVDLQRKTINILLPEAYDELNEITALFGYEEWLEYLGELSGNAEEDLIVGLIKQCLNDIYLTTDYRIEIGGKLPTETGSYDVYILTIPNYVEDDTTTTDESSGTVPPAQNTFFLAVDTCNLTIEKTNAAIEKLETSSETIVSGTDALLSVRVQGVTNGALPTGTVGLRIYRLGQLVEMKNVELANGTATWTVKNLTPGIYTWKWVSYSGDTHYQSLAEESDAFALTVTKATDPTPEEPPTHPDANPENPPSNGTNKPEDSNPSSSDKPQEESQTRKDSVMPGDSNGFATYLFVLMMVCVVLVQKGMLRRRK